jgi:clan AA aspartic protease (TIGR02281 family)
MRLFPVVLVIAAALAALSGAAGATEAARVTVAAELARLAAAHGFTVAGDEHLEDSTGRAEGQDPFRRLRVLLEGFDHIIVQDAQGGIDHVIVLGVAMPGATSAAVTEEPMVAVNGEPPPDAPIELPTIRNGSQHSVRVALEGAEGRRLARILLIDTGADTVVLPASLIGTLGIDPDSLEAREVQTANGVAEAQTGVLGAVWLGAQRVPDVAVAFLPDDRLGNNGLLGMSVLGRYQMTIDDQGNRLTLSGR